MIKINICGDFFANNVSDFNLDDELQELLSGSDINIINLEAPIIVKEAKPIKKVGLTMHQDPNVINILEEKGFNGLSLANNHIMDYGSTSLLNTREKIKKSKAIGAGYWTDAYNIEVYEVSNIKIGFLAFTQCEFGVLENEFEYKNSIGTAWMTHPIINRLIIDCKKKIDYLFLLPHAGLEFELHPLPELRELYRHYIDIGADGIFASHPHTPQGWETYKNKPICYSLGNFFFTHNFKNVSQYFHNGIIASITINNGIYLEIKHTCFSPSVPKVFIDNSIEIQNLSKTLNKTLQDQSIYIEEVNNMCKKYEDVYDLAFAKGGYFKYGTKKFLKQIIRQLLGIRYPEDYNHTLNNIRCEAHRWTIQRILKEKMKDNEYKK